MSRRHDGSENRETKKEHTAARGARLMDLYCRHFFKRFRTTFERRERERERERGEEERRASHFSKIPRAWARQKIAIDSPHANGFELNHDPLTHR